jgi:hypothetical protein
MDETYRMLGKEHEADLEREAVKWRRATELRPRQREARRMPAEALKSRLYAFNARARAFANRAARIKASPGLES